VKKEIPMSVAIRITTRHIKVARAMYKSCSHTGGRDLDHAFFDSDGTMNISDGHIFIRLPYHAWMSESDATQLPKFLLPLAVLKQVTMKPGATYRMDVDLNKKTALLHLPGPVNYVAEIKDTKDYPGINILLKVLKPVKGEKTISFDPEVLKIVFSCFRTQGNQEVKFTVNGNREAVRCNLGFDEDCLVMPLHLDEAKWSLKEDDLS